MNELTRLEVLGSIYDLCARSVSLRRLGQNTEAKAAVMSALVLFRTFADLDEINMAIILNELGNACFCLHEFDEAEMHYRQSISCMEKVFDPEHACLAMVLDHLARLYIFEEDFDQAEPICQRSLAIKTKSLPAEDSRRLESLRMTAIVKIGLYKLEEAEELVREAIEILEPLTIGPLEEFLRLLAHVYEGQGKQKESEECYKRAIEVFVQQKGEPAVLAQCEMDYARLLEEQGRYAEARRARREAEVAEAHRRKLDDLPESPAYHVLSYPVTIFH